MNLRHAAKLTSIYSRQMEVLDRHRGLGALSMTKNVRVEPGAQAIVGHVEVNRPPAVPASAANDSNASSMLAPQASAKERKGKS